MLQSRVRVWTEVRLGFVFSLQNKLACGVESNPKSLAGKMSVALLSGFVVMPSVFLGEGFGWLPKLTHTILNLKQDKRLLYHYFALLLSYN